MDFITTGINMHSLPSQGISVVIAVFNEVDNIEPLIIEVNKAINHIHSKEIIVVDDGSRDGTSELLLSLNSHIPELKVVQHVRNYGQSIAVINGVRAAQYDWIITLDGDGQNDPADFHKLLTQVETLDLNRPILIAGNRAKRNDTWLRRMSSKIANGLRRRMLRDDCPDSGCGLKLFQRQVFLQLPHFNHLHRFLPALFKRANGIIVNIPVNHRPRTRGTSKYGMMNRLWVGIVDLFGVMWLIRRPCHTETRDVS